MADSSKKSYYEDVIKDAGLDPVTSEELQSKFDAITKAEYDKQRTNLQTATNKYYNQLYDTQQTTMDTIRQANAQAVASGASKGVQAANELSALLGLQSEAVTGATDLANQATTLAQDESQAMLENMLTAETQAAEQNQALAQILTQAGSVDVENQNANTAKQQVLQQYWDRYLQAMADGNTTAANKILAEMRAYSTNITNTPPSTNEDTPNEDVYTDPYAEYGTYTEDGNFKLNNGITGTLDTVNNQVYANGKIYDVSGALKGYDTSDINKVYANLASDYGFTTTKRNIIDTNRPQSEWGGALDQVDFDHNTSKGKAGEYINKIITAAARGFLPVGAVVQFQYGAYWDAGSDPNRYRYVYLGNGKFAQVHHDTAVTYTPSGYYWSGSGDTTVQKK
jgi:hypothetical protein